MRRTWISVLVALVAGTALAAGADQCPIKCNRPDVRTNVNGKPDVKTKHIVVINATTGQRIDGGLVFPQTDEVAVIFKKNPFKYSYRIGVTTSPLETALASGFLRLIPNFGGILDGALGKEVQQGAAPGAELPRPTPLEPGGPCEGINTGIVGNQAVRALTTKSEEIKKELLTLKDSYTTYEKFFKLTDTEDLANPCAVCTDAIELNGVIGSLADVSGLAARIEKFKAAVEPYKEAIKKIQDVPACATSLSSDFKAIAALPEDAEIYAKAVKKLQDNKASFELMETLLKATLASDQAFWEVRYPQTAGDATDVTINIAVKHLRIADSPTVPLDPIHLTIGESRFKLTAGFGFSTLNDVKIVRQSSVDADNAIANRFGYENKAPFKPSVLVMMNAPLKNWKHVSLGLNTGLVVSSRESGASVEYTAGGSLGFLRNSLFLNAGFHTARVERLGGGFHIGDLVPPNLPDPLPIEKNWSYGALISITYKIR